MDIHELADKLQERLAKPLPGSKSHLKMASSARIKWNREMPDASKARESAIMILLYPDQGEIYSVLILRPDYGGVHSGQVSFPGGQVEKTDTSLAETALRETMEEIGLDTISVNIIGRLSRLYIPPSNFNVHPFIGYLEKKPALVPDPEEVASIHEVRIVDLINPANYSIKQIKTRYAELRAPCILLNGLTIWGATAMIISELIDVMKEARLIIE
jgi:8-oxo-dGTP pyrophosphatase MutT (NUDIX family)